jgi:4-hydroxy-tetrahydrodipicolinate synthase
MMAQVMAAFSAGDIERARDIFDAYIPMMRYESQPGMGLAIRKYSLAKQGVIAHPTIRKPGAGLTPAAIAEVDALAERQETRLKELGLAVGL